MRMKRTTVVFLTMMFVAAVTAEAYSTAPCAGMLPLAGPMVMSADRACCAPDNCDCQVQTAPQADSLSFAWVQSRTGFSMPPEDGGIISADSVTAISSDGPIFSQPFSSNKRYKTLSQFRI